ncbi:hypothetical protein [Nocardia thraciensis]
MSVSFTPRFAHKDWIDNQSLVQAAGDDGFNVRFHNIETDFVALAAVVKAISDTLDTLGHKPPPKPVTLTLAPILAPLSSGGWSLDPGAASKPVGATQAGGLINVTLPQGALIQSMRLVGTKRATGTVGAGLFRQSLSGAAAPESIADITAPATAGGFDQTAAADAQRATVDNKAFIYYLIGDVINAGANDPVALQLFQITYVPQ